jgi:protein arginine kinase activator
MLCPECGKRPATIHYTKIVNGEKSEFHLCEVCAQGKEGYMSGFESEFSIQQLLSGLLNYDYTQTASGHPGMHVNSVEECCPHCGLTYKQFGKLGRFGCGECYHTFQGYLDPLFRKMHGHTIHRGKVPMRAKGELKLRRDLEQLREELAHKIAQEEFEEAARLRDQIRALQGRLNH